jgi:hypothetical protein
MLVRWWRRISLGASLGRRWLRDSGAFAGRCCQVVCVGALVGRCRCHGVGAGAQVSEGRDLTINLRGGSGGERGAGRGEGDAQHDEQHVEGAVAFWGDVAVHRVVLLGGGRLCDERRARGQRQSGECCGASGGIVGGEVAVQDTVEAVGREGGVTDHTGVVGRNV